MFSFGSIKTNTALGGAVFFVREQELQAQMASNQSHWPQQTEFAFAERILKYAFVKTVSTWPVAAMVRSFYQMRGADHDKMASQLAKGSAGANFLERIRQQPSKSLSAFLAHRIESFDEFIIASRIERAEHLIDILCQSGDAGWHAIAQPYSLGRRDSYRQSPSCGGKTVESRL